MRATTRENILAASVETEKNRAIAKEAFLEDKLSTEEVARADADAELLVKIDTNASGLQDEIARATAAEEQESRRAMSAEATLQAAIDTETARAMTKENAIETTLNNVISNIDPAALDSLSEIVQRMSEVDSSAFHRISTIEAYIKQAFDLESLYPLTVTDMKQEVFAISSHAQVFPDEQPPTYCEPGGWKFTNTEAGKINWYFVAQDNTQHKTLEDYSGFYAQVKLDSIVSLPFFNVYTKPKGDGTDASSWYGSRRTYVFPSDHGVQPGEDVLMYFGADLPATYPDMKHVQLVLDPGSSNGSDDPSQEFLFIAFSTNSGAVLNGVNICAKAFIYGDGKHTHIQLYSEPPPPSTMDLLITTTPGTWPSELWSSISTEYGHTGDIVWAQGPAKFLNPGPLTDYAVTVPTGVELFFNAMDTYGDGWNGATFSIRNASTGDVIIDNNGLSPNEAGELAGSFAFQV